MTAAPVAAGRVAGYAADDRLPFALPDFTRRSWVNERARATWEPRLERIGRAWADTEWLSVVHGVRSCALVALAPGAVAATVERWKAHRLSALGVPVSTDSTGLTFAVVGGLEEVRRAHDAWVARDDEEVGVLLGYPACCRAFFREVWVEQRCTDTTWAMAASTAPPEGGVVTIEGAGGDPLANILWRWVGVRAVPHLPCRFDCRAASQLGQRLLGVAEGAGFAEEARWIREVLSWPVEWSALHGIAEVKTPVFKLSTRTDATAGKYVVRWQGSGYPEEGATGLRFPFQSPARRPMTEGRSFQLGLKRPLDAPDPAPDWVHGDNGFASREAMRAMHRPLVALARRQLAGGAGRVLDLGCGNGALLAKICEGQSGLEAHGVDRNRAALEHAKVLLPRFAGGFVAGDIFDAEGWSGGPRYALSVLMAGRLLEVERPAAERLLAALTARSEAVLLYVYPGPGVRPLASVAREMGLALHPSDDASVALLAGREARADDALDWHRLAEPQADHYDTDAVLRRVATTTTAGRPAPYRRTPVGDAPTLFDGCVAVRPVYRGVPEFRTFSDRYLDAPADHPNLLTAAEHVRTWPTAFAQAQRLLEAIHPGFDVRIPFETAEIYRGSSCHSYEALFGTLWSTIYCAPALAEAIIHEMAHQKLRALGVAFESSTTIVGNDPQTLHVSPVIKDRQRPMTAVLHAQYSYVHVTALDVHLVAAERDPERRRAFAVVLERNLGRIAEGRETLARHFQPGEHGEAFMAGLAGWTDRVMSAAREQLGG